MILFFLKEHLLIFNSVILEIEFTMPLRNKRQSYDGTSIDTGYDTQDSSISQQQSEDSLMSATDQLDDDDPADEEWLHSMGVNADDIKQINYTQVHNNFCFSIRHKYVWLSGKKIAPNGMRSRQQ